jgi:hypothetical protein
METPPNLQVYDLGHLGLPLLHLSAFGGAGGRVVELEGGPLVLNLALHHETAGSLMGEGRYYLLE